MAAAGRRPRALANPDVADQDFIECISEFTQGVSIHHVLGPKLANGMHQVTPNMVVRLCPLLESLFKKDVRNGVVYPNKLEVCLESSCSSSLPMEINGPVYFHQVTEHVRHCLAVLREMKRESCSQGPQNGKRSKVGGFRRACGSSDTIIIKGMLDKMELDSSSTPDLQSPLPSPLPSPRSDRDHAEIDIPKLDLPQDTDLDADGYPKIFTNATAILAQMQLSIRSSGSAASIPSTAVHGEDGFPLVGGSDCQGGQESDDQGDDDGEGDQESDGHVLDPQPKRRKATALAGRSSGKGKGKGKGKAKGKAKAKPKPKPKAVARKDTEMKATIHESPSVPPRAGLLCRPSMAGPTAESDPRCELTAREYQADGSLRRVCIWSARVRLCGDSLAADMRKMYAAIDGGTMTKQKCLDMRDRMK